jgi:bacterioferritin
MPSKENKAVLERLNNLLEMELSGVIRYLHYAFMVRGPNRIPIVQWFRDQANEGLAHANVLGEKMTALGGHPSLKVRPVPETKQHAVVNMLKESLEFERQGLAMYRDLLEHVGDDIALEELVRDQIRAETEHIEEVEKMLAADRS